MSNRRDKSRATSGPSQRQLRVGEELRHALSRILQRRELRDPALTDAVITVTEVRISPDLRNATAFVVPLGGAHADAVMAALQRSAPFLRGLLGHEVPLRYVPQLRLALDTSFDHASRIDALLHRPEVERSLHSEDAAEEDDGP
jgi:ribosome-binding factor A